MGSRTSRQDILPSRRLSLFERYSLVSWNTGFPEQIVYLATFSDQRKPPSLSHLNSRVSALQDHFPLLWTDLVGPKTAHPHFRQRSRGKWSPEEIIRVETVDMAEDGGDARQQEADLMGEELARVEKEAVAVWTERPPWQITVFQHPDSTPLNISLTIDHSMTDGVGALRLFLLLLQPPESNVLQALPTLPLDKTPRLEDTIPMTPTISYLLSQFYADFVYPILPGWVQSSFGRIPQPWPGTAVRSPVLESNYAMTKGGLLETDIVLGLRSHGVTNGIPSLHPLLQTAYVLALWSVVRPKDSAADQPPVVINGVSPISERSHQELSHDPCLGNCIVVLEHKEHLSPASQFWELARSLSEDLRSEVGRKRARMFVGQLKAAPGGAIKDKGGRPEGEPFRTPTQWEKMFLGKALSKTPASMSVCVSNLGRVDTVPANASYTDVSSSSNPSLSSIPIPEDVISNITWSQSAAAIAPPLTMNVIGFRGRITWTSTFREDVFLSREEVEEIDRIAEAILNRVAIGACARDMTIGQLTGGL